jgi:asparagine synthase (glutamine-hydrolysing)
MCGIAGLIAPDMTAPERLDLVRAMVARLRHRGPSGEAVWDGGECALGIARLAIVAPREPARVLESETTDVVGVANGEIYNHRALEHDLRARGHDIPSGPDTTLLPHLYEERGHDFPEALDGMFAIALWDRTTRTLTLVRDRAGEKPLFVASNGRRFAFAQSPRRCSRCRVSRDPSPAALVRFLVHGAFAARTARTPPSASCRRHTRWCSGTAANACAATGGLGRAAAPRSAPGTGRRAHARARPVRPWPNP